MTSNPELSRDDYLACNWQYDVPDEERYGYSSIMQHLQNSAKEKAETGQEEQARILELLSRCASMMLEPSSVNQPFRPFFTNYQTNKRSALPEDFTDSELNFFESILEDIELPLLKARVADVLWLCRKPRNPDHANAAIHSYLLHKIDAETWLKDIDDCWKRAARLCKQIGDREQLSDIGSRIYAAFQEEYPNDTFMLRHLAELMDQLKIDIECREDIAGRLMSMGNSLQGEHDFNAARSYFELAEKKFKQTNDEQGQLECLLNIAEGYEKEGDTRCSSGSNIAASSFYENAIQAYRCTPTKHREEHNVQEKIKRLLDKNTASGQASFDEMTKVQTPGIDITQMRDSSIAHVANKETLEEALMYFVGLFPAPSVEALSESAARVIQQNPLTSMAGASFLSSDGRVVAKTPPMNIEGDENNTDNQLILHRQMQQLFAIDIQLAVEGQIIPALQQILREHRVTRSFLIAMCRHSPIVPDKREKLLSDALWQGFEHDFGSSIHLLCPQLEHIVRTQLKSAGAHTTHIDQGGIEHEIGLSKLMGLPEASQIFDKDSVYEIKSIFTDSLGSNLRNDVAHGLLDDSTAASTASIYAWWIVLRMIIHAVIRGTQYKNS
jgi:tetratricopeptide (TPR) repeat protein